MAYLRLVHSVAFVPRHDDACLEAFDRQLDYVFMTLRRLGAQAGELEDLAQEVFVVLHRNWGTQDTTRSLRPYLFGVAFRIVCARRRCEVWRRSQVTRGSPEIGRDRRPVAKAKKATMARCERALARALELIIAQAKIIPAIPQWVRARALARARATAIAAERSLTPVPACQ